MKRFLSFMLAMILILTPCQKAAYAAAGDKPEKAQAGRKAAAGQVDVAVISALKMAGAVDFSVELSGKTTNKEKQLTLLEDDPEKQFPERAETSFADLEPGSYKLEVTAPGFAGYSQDITVEADRAHRVKLMTGFISGYDYENSAHPGVLLIGDVNGDGKIDGKDKELLTNAVDAAGKDTGDGASQQKSKDADSGSVCTDLNRDGKVDLADLEYFSKGYQEARKAQSTVETGIPASVVTVQPDADTKVSGGKPEELLTYGSLIELSRNDGKKIEEGQPVEITFEVAAEGGNASTGGMEIETNPANPITKGEIEVTDADGTKQTIQIPDKNSASVRSLRQARSGVTVKQSENGTISINFGTQVAVKRVVFKITGVGGAKQTLAEISKVTFIGDMASRIPEPETDIPTNLKALPGSASFTLDWDACENITGYEVEVSTEETGQEGDAKEEEINEPVVIQVTGNTLSVSSLSDDKKVENYKKYKARVRSVNGLWRSGYSDFVTVEPKPTSPPDAPDNVSAVGKYKSIQVSWKKMKDSESYNLYYKRAEESQYTKIEGITENAYTLTGLGERVKYMVYVTGVNQLGEGKPSLTSSAVTTSMELANVPKYKLINRVKNGQVSPHIANAYTGSGGMEGSAKDSSNTAWGCVDQNIASYYLLNSWDSGGFNSLGKNGIFVEFDEAYKMQVISLQEPVSQDIGYAYAQVRYWDADGKETLLQYGQISVQKKTDEEGRVYYKLRLPYAITAKKIQIGLARSVASGTIAVSEIYFYHYDPLEDEIMALYTDDLHTVLRSDVTKKTIEGLRARINTKEAESGEYHPDREMLLRELQTAEDILNDKPSESVRIHSGITTKDVNRGFGGLNAWQPIGITAASGDEITVYAGHGSKRTGDSTQLQLVATQYHSESSPMFKVVAALKIGRNDITIPQIGSIDKERGGALYVQYTGAGANDDYAVRVNGGVQVPILDLYQVTDESVRMQRINDYISKLEAYVNTMPQTHEQLHMGSKNQNVKYAYEKENCILGATDIMLDTMMLSLPATQVIKGIGTGDKAGTLAKSMQSLEDMMHLFYQHKGLNQNATNAVDKIPSGHQNIRYQRMFAGAFMYASGNHVGIEYNETAGMVNSPSVTADAQGRYQSGRFFGWGIAHEIGHCINQGAYAIAEITNNYFSVLAQAKDRNDSVRFSYDEVYKKVTSNEKGRATNVFTQLGMYWQLHLAYDKGYNYKTYDDYKEQLENLFFARVDSYARTPANAPNNLTLTGDKDQQLMRLSCAAAGKNILEFFRRWGMTPDAETESYAAQFPEETRAIYYASDNARAYQLTEGNSALTKEQANLNTAAVNQENGAVSITVNLPSGIEDQVLGYEIARTVKAPGGKTTERQLAGFAVPKGAGTVEFKDKVTTMNNRAITYEITLVDQFLNRVATKTLNPIKVSLESYIDKSAWEIKAENLTVKASSDVSDFASASEDASGGESDSAGDMDCKEEKDALAQAALKKAIDGDDDTFFTGTAADGQNAQLILGFDKSYAVTALRYCGSPASCNVYIRDVDKQWKKIEKQLIAGGITYLSDNKNELAYYTDALKLEYTGQEPITVNEIDVIRVAGDNVEFGLPYNGGTVNVGVLQNAFEYGNGSEDGSADVISPGAIVFTGSYRGNPAYNVVMLYDENGNEVGGKGADGSINASQLCLADVPKDGPIQNVGDGKWIYYIEPQYAEAWLKEMAGKKVRAELYRVDNAETNEGERLVSDTDFITIPSISELPSIEIESIGGSNASADGGAEGSGT